MARDRPPNFGPVTEVIHEPKMYAKCRPKSSEFREKIKNLAHCVRSDPHYTSSWSFIESVPSPPDTFGHFLLSRARKPASFVAYFGRNLFCYVNFQIEAHIISKIGFCNATMLKRPENDVTIADNRIAKIHEVAPEDFHPSKMAHAEFEFDITALTCGVRSL